MNWMKVYVIRSKNGMIMNVGVNLRNKMIKVFVKKVIGESLKVLLPL